MSKLPADDLFEKSSMSFGEHLEELRKALMKAFLWLGFGTAIGLIFANQIVRYIHTPLKQAISDFYIEQAKAQFKEANGVEPPEKLAAWLNREGITPERVFIDPAALDFGDWEAPNRLAVSADSAESELESDYQKGTGNQTREPPVNPSAKEKPVTEEEVAGNEAKRTVDTEKRKAGSAKTVETESNADEPKSDKQGREQNAAQQNDESTEIPEAAGDLLRLESPTQSSERPQPETSERDLTATADEETVANPWTGVDVAKLERLQPVLLWRPVQNKLVTLNALESFMIWLKAGLLAGCVIGSPGIFWHIWEFLAAGLYPHERRYVYWYLPLSLLLFLSGVVLAFFVVFRLVLGFLMTYTAGLDVQFTPRLDDYMSFALFLPLGFGIAFQLPIVMLGLHRFGIVSVSTFSNQWRIAVLAIAFLSMMLTPADIYSMLGLFLPLVGLYFLGILLCKYMPQGAGIGAPALDPQG